MELECEADGNPDPSYVWFRNGDENKVLGSSSKLEITLSDKTIGTYTCRTEIVLTY